MVVGGGEGAPSDDGRYLPLLGTSAAGESALVYDLSAGRLVGQRLLGPAGSVDWVGMSQTGGQVVVSFFADGPGASQGVAVSDPSLSAIRHLTDSSEHADLGRTTAGLDVYVTVDYRGPTERILSYPLSGGAPTVVLETDRVGTHVSCEHEPARLVLPERHRSGPAPLTGSGTSCVHARRERDHRVVRARVPEPRRPVRGPRLRGPEPHRRPGPVGSDWLGGPTAPGYAYVASAD